MIEVAFSGFWPFVGVVILLAMLINLVFMLWNRLMRHLSIRKHGWPPPHCDADGDFRPRSPKKEDEDDD
jgi:hypothetical protein